MDRMFCANAVLSPSATGVEDVKYSRNARPEVVAVFPVAVD